MANGFSGARAPPGTPREVFRDEQGLSADARRPARCPWWGHEQSTARASRPRSAARARAWCHRGGRGRGGPPAPALPAHGRQHAPCRTGLRQLRVRRGGARRHGGPPLSSRPSRPPSCRARAQARNRGRNRDRDRDRDRGGTRAPGLTGPHRPHGPQAGSPRAGGLLRPHDPSGPPVSSRPRGPPRPRDPTPIFARASPRVHAARLWSPGGVVDSGRKGRSARW
jgi:hypothetical protein